ncbi:helix-turn-helix domain-containing protein [Paenibacillus sp. MBLB4367]|uniref:helix-turn-helix domain-containing protein n=1 Tax=Paenibacillus sp. MBLB4367 TaxID=3384767 RepID=UPI0039082D32
MMRTALQVKLKMRSVFVKLLIHFLIIILLFVSFNMFALRLFRQDIHEEILKYNNTNMASTTNSFEQYFQLLNNVALNMYLSNAYFQNAGRQAVDYTETYKLMTDLQNTVSNPQLFLNNLFVYDKKLSLVLEKSRGASPEGMFGEHYTHANFTYAFWQKEFESSFAFKLYPAAEFEQASSIPPVLRTGLVIPYMVKSSVYPGYVILAFIDAKQLYQALHLSINDNFYILDPQGMPVFTSDSTGERKLPELEPGKDWVKTDHFYYFYEKGANTGFTYVNIVPDDRISSQLRYNVTLVALLIVSVIISIAASVFFSMRFNNPVKKIVESIRHLNEKKEPGGTFSEFELISENIGRMLKLNKDALSDLEEKKSLLRYHSFINRMKKIRSDNRDAASAEADNKPFRFLLFQLTFKMTFWEDMRGEEERAAYFIREYLNQAIGKEFEDAQTFQIEANQILSIVYADGEDERWKQMLEHIRTVLATDKGYCFFTIAVSSVYEHSAQMTAAYEEVLLRVKQRPFDDETRVLYGGDGKEEPFLLNGGIEQEINVNLREGNESLVLQSLRRIMGQMAKKQASTLRFHRFAEEMTDKIVRLLHDMQLDTRAVSGMPGAIPQLQTMEQLEGYFQTVVGEAALMIRLKKEEHDPIVSFVNDYLERHYAEDITLDLVAGHLNITGGYLSTYFKDRTGTNFVDFVGDFRVKKAMDLLMNTEMKVQDIATSVGYQTMSSFNRTFKRFSGVTPTEYRRNPKREEEVG